MSVLDGISMVEALNEVPLDRGPFSHMRMPSLAASTHRAEDAEVMSMGRRRT